MIISASRRTDIPAFYAEWFINRIRAGTCTVANPFNPSQISEVSLRPQDVDVIVFWTRNPQPLFPYLDELDRRGFRYYFQYTLLDYPRLIEPLRLPLRATIRTFQQLARRVGQQRVIWRYDPIIFSQITPPAFHRQAYAQIAQALEGYTQRSVISLLDIYSRQKRQLAEMAAQGAALTEPTDVLSSAVGELLGDLAQIARRYKMEIFSCAEEHDLTPYGIQAGKCIDDDYIRQVFGLEVIHTKDPGQRKACGCVISKDIGAYDTCLFGCPYCYATHSLESARLHHQQHDPQSPALSGGKRSDSLCN